MEGLRPEIDELDRFKKRAEPAAKKEVKKTPSDKSPPPVTAKSGSGVSLLLSFIIVLALFALGWYSWQQQQEIDRLNERLGDASGFMDQSKLLIARLEGKLSETGEVLAETGTSAEKKLAFLDTEMRKLWGVSNDRNKKAIEENQQALAGLDKKLDQIQKASTQEIAAISGELKDVLKLIKEFDARASTLANEMSVLKTEQDSVNASVKSQLTQQKQLVEGFKKDAQSYLERMAKMDLSVESINVSRRQLNERVVDLDKKVNELMLKLSGPRS